MGYNGWKNRATWLVNLHFDDYFDASRYDSIEQLAEDIRRTLEDMTENAIGENGFLQDMVATSLSEIDYYELAEVWYEDLED